MSIDAWIAQALLLCADHLQLPLTREIPEHGSDQEQRRHVTNQVTCLVSVIHGLYCHDAGVHDARPDRERDQAAMLGRITRSSNEIGSENRVNPADHLEVILAMATVPLPSRRPDEAERVDGEEDCAECNQSNLEELFARGVVHVESPVD